MIVSATPTCCDEIGVPWESWLQRLCIWLAAGDCYVDIITPWSGYYSNTCRPFSLRHCGIINIITNITARGCFSSQRPSPYCVFLFTFSDSKKTVSQTVNLIAGKLELMRTWNPNLPQTQTLKNILSTPRSDCYLWEPDLPGHRVPICHSFVGGKDPLWRWWDQN